MTDKFYTFRGKNSGHVYYAIAHNAYQAAKEIGIRHKDLILLRSEVLPRQLSLEETLNVK